MRSVELCNCCLDSSSVKILLILRSGLHKQEKKRQWQVGKKVLTQRPRQKLKTRMENGFSKFFKGARKCTAKQETVSAVIVFQNLSQSEWLREQSSVSFEKQQWVPRIHAKLQLTQVVSQPFFKRSFLLKLKVKQKRQVKHKMSKPGS